MNLKYFLAVGTCGVLLLSGCAVNENIVVEPSEAAAKKVAVEPEKNSREKPQEKTPRHYQILNEMRSGCFVGAESPDKSEKLMVYYTVVIGKGDNETYSDEASFMLLTTCVLFENGEYVESQMGGTLLGSIIIENHKNANFIEYKLKEQKLLYSNVKVMPMWSWGNGNFQVRINGSGANDGTFRQKLLMNGGVSNGTMLRYSINFSAPNITVCLKNQPPAMMEKME
ncbi:MAG: hypothetical protein RRY34_02605 [Victivallaceae bacterium]